MNMEKVTVCKPRTNRCVVRKLDDEVIERLERDAGKSSSILAINFKSSQPHATIGSVLEIGPDVTDYEKGDLCIFVEETSLAFPILGQHTYIIEDDALLGKPDVSIV